MGRGKFLSEGEKETILLFRYQGQSGRSIAKGLKRSVCVVGNFLRNPAKYGTKKSTGRPSKLSGADKRRILRLASTGKKSARDIKNETEVSVGLGHIQKIISSSPNLVQKKRKHAPVLTSQHKVAREKFAVDAVQLDSTWDKIILSDEKFNLDGPDGLQFYWHDLREEEQMFSTRQCGGGGVMVWGAFSRRGKSHLCMIETTQDSARYVHTLSEYLLPFARLHYGTEFIFQQDNAPIHTSRVTRGWLEEQDIQVMKWPSKSPDLNPIENLWGILARRVYNNGHQFQTVKDLKEAILKYWDEIGQDTIDSLIDSMPKRCCDVIRLCGAKTKY